MKYLLHCSSCCHSTTRLDNYLVNLLPWLPFRFSRTQLVNALSKITVNNKVCKRSVLINKGDELCIEFTITEDTSAITQLAEQRSGNKIVTLQSIQSRQKEKNTEAIIAKIRDLDIVYENEQIIVVNKARGQVVHPGAGNHEGTLAQMVLPLLKNFREEDYYNNRAGIVHRLDKDTTGLIVIAKTAKMHEKLSKLFANRKIIKQYLAIIKKIPAKPVGTISTFIGRDAQHRKKFSVQPNEARGKIAETSYRVLFSNHNYSLVLCMPHTGRTHQIRVHMQHLGTPIIGDNLYARKEKAPYTDMPLMLHAYTLKYTLNVQDNIEEYAFTAPIPQSMLDMLATLGMTKDISTLL